VKFIPVVKIVQVHRIAWGLSIIGNIAIPQNTLAGGVIGIITADGGVMLLNRLGIK
jgi:hypothetical protein